MRNPILSGDSRDIVLVGSVATVRIQKKETNQIKIQNKKRENHIPPFFFCAHQDPIVGFFSPFFRFVLCISIHQVMACLYQVSALTSTQSTERFSLCGVHESASPTLPRCMRAAKQSYSPFSIDRRWPGEDQLHSIQCRLE